MATSAVLRTMVMRTRVLLLSSRSTFAVSVRRTRVSMTIPSMVSARVKATE